MSWSINAKGSPAAVKELLIDGTVQQEAQFAYAKRNTASVPVEQKIVESAEQICKDALENCDYPYVEVSGHGSGSNGPETEEQKALNPNWYKARLSAWI